jgi:amino acid transporter
MRMPGAGTTEESTRPATGPDGSSPSAGARREILAPEALSITSAGDLPETIRYRLKRMVLGPPLATERESMERLGKPAALAVLSSDVISSSAYATEELLVPLVPAIGVAAFSLVVPITIAVIAVLVVVTLSYLEVVKVYTQAGGAYIVTRENFGPNLAQIAAVALLVDYTLTVAVSVAAGVAAVTSVFPVLGPATVWLSVGLVLVLAYGNLRGVREAGRVFAIPTYFFIVNMVLMIAVGAVRAIAGTLHAHSIHQAGAFAAGMPGSGLFRGAALFIVLRAFASGGAALTGTEAISNGVGIFRPPESRNARLVLAMVAVLLGSLVLGTAFLASVTHPVPMLSGSPTVLAQIAKYVYGTSVVGHLLFVLLQAGTMLILVLAANTSFTGFPYLASFAAADSYLPRQLLRRGHRLVFSTGMIVLTVVSVVLLLATRARVDALIPLYAIGVFTGFTLAGAGLAKYHLVHREPQWRRRLFINASAAVLSFVVDMIFAVTKFTEGAWVVVIIMPLGVFGLIRLHRQYVREDVQLETGAVQACEAHVLRRHSVVVLVDHLDMATARAIQYARTLHPDELRAVHFAIDPRDAAELEREWGRLGLSRLPLDIVECPDRRLARAALELASEATSGGETELSILLPRRGYTSGWRRLLHDRTADRISVVVGELPHVNATIVPFKLAGGWREHGRERLARMLSESEAPRIATSVGLDEELGRRAGSRTPIGEVTWRQRARIAGRVHSTRVPTMADRANLECVLADGSGAILLVFQGRRQIPGVRQGARLVAEGRVGSWNGHLAILNPDYELVAEEGSGEG